MTQSNGKHIVDWEAMYWQLLPRIYNYHRYRVGNNATAQDLTSATFVRAWRFRHKYNHELGKFEAWLFTIARNVAMDYLRAQSPEGISIDTLYDLAYDQGVEQEIQKRLAFAELHHQLTQLSTREQEIIALKFGADMTNRAIAQALDISESNIGTILYRTMRKLREQLESDYGR